MKNKDWLDRANIWESWYSKLNQPLSAADLPLSLSLIHPSNHRNWNGSKINLSEAGWGPKKGVRCEFLEISGIECPWNEDPILRTTMNRDHRWPKSLGGPISGYNLLWLCETHNLAKGNGLWGFDWGTVPAWLESRLNELRERKLKGIVQDD